MRIIVAKSCNRTKAKISFAFQKRIVVSPLSTSKKVIVTKTYIISFHITYKKRTSKVFLNIFLFYTFNLSHYYRTLSVPLSHNHCSTNMNVGPKIEGDRLKFSSLRSYPTPKMFHKKVNVAIILCLVTHLCLIFSCQYPTGHFQEKYLITL